MEKKLITVGWREWVRLPDLFSSPIKAKIDSGARTSCLHTFDIESYTHNGKLWVHFGVHPNQNDSETEVYMNAEVVDKRMVSDSGGHKEERFVICTTLDIGIGRWPIEVNLTNRDSMRFRMLLGRTALNGRVQINPAKSYLLEGQ